MSAPVRARFLEGWSMVERTLLCMVVILALAVGVSVRWMAIQQAIEWFMVPVFAGALGGYWFNVQFYTRGRVMFVPHRGARATFASASFCVFLFAGMLLVVRPTDDQVFALMLVLALPVASLFFVPVAFVFYYFLPKEGLDPGA